MGRIGLSSRKKPTAILVSFDMYKHNPKNVFKKNHFWKNCCSKNDVRIAQLIDHDYIPYSEKSVDISGFVGFICLCAYIERNNSYFQLI